MNRLLKIEWLKIIHYRTAWVFILLYFLLLVLMGLLIPQVKPNINGTEIDFVKYGAYNFPVVWHNITYFAAIGKIFLAVIIVTNVTNEYSNRTLKQNLIDGLSKREFLISKLSSVLIFALLSTVVVFAIALGLGLQNNTAAASAFSGLSYIGVYALKLVFFFTFVLFLSFLFRKSAFAILMLFVWWIAESILTGMEYFVRGKLLGQHMDDVTFITQFLPLNTSSSLITFPRISLDNLMQGLPPFIEQDIAFTPILVATAYTGLFVYLSYVLLKKRNL